MADNVQCLTRWQFDFSWYFYAFSKTKRLLRRRVKQAVMRGGKVRNKGSESLQGNMKHFALGFLVKRTATSPDRKPAVPESNPRWSQLRIEEFWLLVWSKYSQGEPVEGTMEDNCLPYFVEGILFLFAFSRVIFSEMPRILEVVCWWLMGRVSAVKGVKYARVLLLNFFFSWFQSIQRVMRRETTVHG